jgi:hypothetical protein
VSNWGYVCARPVIIIALVEDGLRADFHFTHDLKDEEARDLMQAANAFR